MVDSPLAAVHSFPPEALYQLLAAQVASYHKHYHMGENTSVPEETARELMLSIGYTLSLAGPREDIRDALIQGQSVQAGLLADARRLLQLVLATGPQDNAWWWEAVETLGRYLNSYDHLHFAHRIPEGLFYPIALPVPEQLQGIHWALFYLQCLWQENQILLGFPEDALMQLYDHLPPGYFDGPEMLCQQPLWNGLGRMLLGLPLDTLLLSHAQREKLLECMTPSAIRDAAQALCQALSLPEPAAGYARAVIGEAIPRIRAALPSRDLSRIFL